MAKSQKLSRVNVNSTRRFVGGFNASPENIEKFNGKCSTSYRIVKYLKGGYGVHQTYHKYDSKGGMAGYERRPVILRGGSVRELQNLITALQYEIDRFQCFEPLEEGRDVWVSKDQSNT